MAEADGPDFLCVGLARCGTGWLYDQLRGHPDFWMPPIKEISYLRNAKAAGKEPRLPEKVARRLDQLRRRPVGIAGMDARDRAFFDTASHAPEEMSLPFYAELFAPKGPLRSGDVSPRYAVLEPVLTQRLAKTFPATKIVMLVRDPVARYWSHLCLRARQGRFDESKLGDVYAVRGDLSRPRVDEKSTPTEVRRVWQSAFGDRFSLYFLDDIAERPDQTRRAILGFLGGDPDAVSATARADENRKSAGGKKEMTEEVRALLVGHFADELRRCAETFGGPAEAWPARYGL